jgi:hypothetical protein
MATATQTLIPTATLTATLERLAVPQPIGLVQPTGQAGVPCADSIEDGCTVSGQVTGNARVIGSMAWTLTALVPTGVALGTSPVAVLSTTLVGLEGFLCSPVVGDQRMVLCDGITIGNALQGSTVTVVFATGVRVTGIVTGPGPRPVVSPLLPPPPQLMPLPPAPVGVSGEATGSFPEVPVIPETNSLVLLADGLAAIGGLLVLRRRRHR